MTTNGHKRVSIENVSPEINCGDVPIKRTINEPIEVTADIFADGHDKVDAVLLFREKATGKRKPKTWSEKPMVFRENDRWAATFEATETGRYEYTISAWVDHFATWQYGLRKKVADKQDVSTELLIGAQLMEEALPRATSVQKKKLNRWIKLLRDENEEAEAISEALSEAAETVMYQTRNRDRAFKYQKDLSVWVERKRALFSAWYEFFPRSTSPEEGKHGTFKDAEKILPEIADMGFDVIYLPPIHPIGKSFRKGRNNAPDAGPNDPGSPWAIGAKEGGHKAIHPELGTLQDFKDLVERTNELGMEIALDFAIQCSQDHPYVKEHPQWFKWRPDGTVQYAENPPKKYQDVLPVNFETEDWENLWQELKSIVVHWIEAGVKIFRVDNPHTKSFIFWKWLIEEVNKKYDGIIFLAEAFTRPRVMEELAKVGFTQSYTYFTWRNTKEDFTEYLTELTKTDLREYFRPNFWPNTPDILPVSLENQPESAFLTRVILAGTLSSNFGIYGPLFEFNLNEAYPGKEEYTRSEKYEIKHWDWKKETKTKEIIRKLNKIRNENPALQTTWNIEFHETDNPQLICYSKVDEASQNQIIVVVNLDYQFSQTGWIHLPLKRFNIEDQGSFQVKDLITGANYSWQGSRNYVALHPQGIPAHILKIENK